MSMKNRSFLLLSSIPAFLLVSGLAVGAQTNWSDPASWPNRKVPVAGDKVTIGRDKQVVLDVSPPALGGVSIDGKLSFSNTADLELTTEWIMLHGELEIGTEARPHTRKATITLTDNVKGEDVMGGMGDRGIMLSGGTLNLHGDRTNTWTKLAQTAKTGSDAIEVLPALAVLASLVQVFLRSPCRLSVPPESMMPRSPMPPITSSPLTLSVRVMVALCV